jgi:hypothetical protein
MKAFIIKMYNNKVGRIILYLVFWILIVPIMIIGRVLFYFSKVIRALGFLLMGEVHSAKEEITEWEIMLNINDVL